MTDLEWTPARCADCLYWRRLREHEGECRRHAPAAATQSETVAHWPQTHDRQWCGEGRARAVSPAVTCAACRFWRSPEHGLNPVDRGDMLMAWWRGAGICARNAPMPVSEPGPRTFWRATHGTDQCGDWSAKETGSTPPARR